MIAPPAHAAVPGSAHRYLVRLSNGPWHEVSPAEWEAAETLAELVHRRGGDVLRRHGRSFTSRLISGMVSVTADLLRSQEAQRMLRVSYSTLRRWESSGRLHPVRTPGGQRRYSKAEITKVWEENTTR